MKKIEHSLSRVQFGIFFNRPINRPDLVSSVISQKFSNVFDAPPINLPLPDDAPFEIPISQLRSKDRVWNLSISKIRADVFFRPSGIDNFEDKNNEKNIKQIEKIILLCADQAREQKIEINRIANISEYILYPDKPTEFLQKAMEIKNFDNMSELNIRINQSSKEESFQINNITTIGNGIETKENLENVVLILTKDINNVISNENKFSNENIVKFFSITGDIVSWKKIFGMFE